jgi:hypothetical protein
MTGNSEAAKKAAITRKEKYGPDYYSRIGGMGARLGTRGYFGYLKANNPKKLRELSKAAAAKSAERTPEERKATVVKGWQTRRRNVQIHGGAGAKPPEK